MLPAAAYFLVSLLAGGSRRVQPQPPFAELKEGRGGGVRLTFFSPFVKRMRKKNCTGRFLALYGTVGKIDAAKIVSRSSFCDQREAAGVKAGIRQGRRGQAAFGGKRVVP